MDVITTSRDPVKSYVRSAICSMNHICCSFSICLYSSSINVRRGSVLLKSMKRQRSCIKQALNKACVPVFTFSSLRLENRSKREGRAHAFFLPFCGSDPVPGNLGSLQGWAPHHVLHLEVAQKWSRLDEQSTAKQTVPN